MAIYTKKGDKGTTSLYDPTNAQMKRVSKNSLWIWAIGSVDEVNSFLGICISLCQDKTLEKSLQRIQRDLLNIGSILSGSALKFPITRVEILEDYIDELESTLPVLKNFILPGGIPLAAHLQYVRALTRRAERRVVALSAVERVKPTVLQYINRLSDYFFMLARKINSDGGIVEDAWMKGKR